MIRKLTHLLLLLVWLLAIESAQAIIDVSLQMQLGNPSGAIADTNNHDHYLILRPIEAIDYNDNLGQPNWASWDLTAEDASGAVDRQDSYTGDTNLPPSFHMVGAGDYAHSGYDRGHLCPSADRTDSTNHNDQTFLMSNMMPQTGSNNSGVWKNFEDYCRSLAINNNELLIICGPSGFDGSRINTNGYVAIPQYTWKIAVVVTNGDGTASSRITTNNRVIVIKVPNTNGVSSVWQNFITSANQIQVDTGFTFFTALSAEIAAVLRNKVDGQTNPPPVIFSFSPTMGSANTNVVIIGTNFTAATEVTFNGTHAGFTVDSDAQITTMVPTNAGSGFISVSTSSGTGISTNLFTVLNNGGTVYSGVLACWDMSTLPGGTGNYGPSPFTPTTNAANLTIVGLTRGSGVRQSGTAAAGGWGGTGFTNISAATAIASNQFATFSVMASNGYKISFLSVSRFDYKRSGTGPTNGVLQYQVGSGVFSDITNVAYSSASNGATNSPIDLSGITALQNVGANTNVTFRIVNYGGSNAGGTWYIYDVAGTTAMDLAVQGTVTQIVNPPHVAPSFSSVAFTNNTFSFLLTGTAGADYVVQATTNLNPAMWVSLATNTAPFSFTETNINIYSQRFYRSLVAP